MLDLALFLFLIVFLAIGFRRPFVWVLAYLYVDILAPGKMGWTFMPILQASLITFIAAFAGWLLTDPKHNSRFTFRQFLLLALLVYCFWTTSFADFPESAAAKWDWVWKALVFAIFLPLTLTTRLRIEGTILIMMLAMAAIIIGPGIKVVLGGGGYENQLFLVNDNSGLYESSVLACMAIAVIPLILWLTKSGTVFPPDWRVRLFAYALIFACLLIPVGTEARTGLVCIAVLGALMFRHVKRKVLFGFAGAIAAVAALPFLPSSFYERMSTIGSFQQDESASTRIAVWTWTLEYVAENPRGGGFDAFRGNAFTYDLPIEQKSGNTTAVKRVEVTDEGRAYHSAYFEVLGEQGIIGFAIWSVLQLTGLWQMGWIRRKYQNRTGKDEQWQAPLATALGKAQIIYLVGALFTGIGYQPFMLMLLAVQIGFTTYVKQCEAKDAPVPSWKRRQQAAQVGPDAAGKAKAAGA